MPKTNDWMRDGTEGGLWFGNAIVTTPLCCPSRSTILTGLYAHNHHVDGNDPTPLFDLRYNTKTLQSYLQDAGYRTGVFGKFLNNWVVAGANPPSPPGFERYAIWNNGPHWVAPGTPLSCDPADPKQGLKCVNDQGTRRAITGHYESHYVVDLVRNFLTDSEPNDSKPWFLYVAPTLPHDPGDQANIEDLYRPPRPIPDYNTPPTYMEEDVADKPPHVQAGWIRPDPAECQSPTPPAGVCGRAAADWLFRQKRDEQFRKLKSLDNMVGDIAAELQRTDRDEERYTLVFFVSDNAYTWGDHWGIGKPWPYLSNVKVPMFMRWSQRPGTPATNEFRNDPRQVSNVDIAPTILSAAHITPDPPMDGRDLYSPAQRTRSFMESTGSPARPSWASLYSPGNYHYIEHYQTTQPPDPRQPPVTDYSSITWREYYDLNPSSPTFDFYEAMNMYGNDGQFGGVGVDRFGAIDPGSPSVPGSLSYQLAQDRTCRGQTPSMAGPKPCP